jgi:hypothetical protein
MRNDEAKIQADIVRWARDAAPHAVIFAVPNDGFFPKPVAAKRKWMGVLAGVPDLCVIDRGGRARFLEVKQPGEKPTDSQEAIIAKLADLEAGCAVVTSIEEAENALAAWGVI